MRELPQFVPILTSYATRVSGRPRAELMKSSAAMSRALADTHMLIGCDGALCFWDPAVLPSACVEGDALRDPEDVIAAPAFQFLVETARTLRKQLPGSCQLFVSFAGPGLLASQVAQAADEGHVEEVVAAAVRAALETGSQGVALIESGSADTAAAYRAVRRLVNFYDAALLVFQLPGTEPSPPVADCVFRLPAGSAVMAVVGTATAAVAPVTTSCDVPPQTPIESIRALREDAARLG